MGAAPAGATASEAAVPPRRRVPRVVKLLLSAVAIALTMNEACVASRANALAGTVAVQDFAGLTELWPQYESLAGRSWLGGAGVSDLKRALSAQTLVLAERVNANYRTPMPTVREN